MTIISIIGLFGLGFDIQQINDNIKVWNLTWLELGFIIFVISFWIVVIKLILRLHKYESKALLLSVKPKTQVGREISLIVHNKGNIPAICSANITCSIIPGKRQLTHIIQLINASMVWENSGIDTETINAGKSKVLKVCDFRSEDRNGSTVYTMNFIKRELGNSETVPCADYFEGDMSTPKVLIDITFGADLSIGGKNEWKYEVNYVLPTSLLHIKSR
uniref:Uncharacterized protein n=1 Tax=viral metagenome TaxID=1070528 RepID=A0A6M3LTU7_9ZZZZ